MSLKSLFRSRIAVVDISTRSRYNNFSARLDIVSVPFVACRLLVRHRVLPTEPAATTQAQLINLATGEVIAPLDEARLEQLNTHLRAESLTGTSFYVTPATVDFLRARDAQELVALLAGIVGNGQGLPIGYAPISEGSARVHGRLLTSESNAPLAGYKIEVYDEDVAFDDLLGWCYSNREGAFELRFDESDFKDLAPPDVEGKPEIKLRIFDVDGEELGWVGLLRALEADFGAIFVTASGKLIAPVLYPGSAAICPKCGTLYRASFSACSEDQTPLRMLGTD